jgi:GNAT superfamily N-acetyltransferase
MYTARAARPDDLPHVLGMFARCLLADPLYLPFIDRADRGALHDWFILKDLHSSFVVVDRSAQVVGFAGLRNAAPDPVPEASSGRWMEACRLGVDPAHRGTQAAKVLTAARFAHAQHLGLTDLWLRCVQESPAHALYLRLGWNHLGVTSFAGEAACQSAVTLSWALRPAPDAGGTGRGRSGPDRGLL